MATPDDELKIIGTSLSLSSLNAFFIFISPPLLFCRVPMYHSSNVSDAENMIDNEQMKKKGSTPITITRKENPEGRHT